MLRSTRAAKRPYQVIDGNLMVMSIHDSNRVKSSSGIPLQPPRHRGMRSCLVPAALAPHHIDSPLMCNWSPHQAQAYVVGDRSRSSKARRNSTQSNAAIIRVRLSAAAVNTTGVVIRRSDKNQRRGTIWRKMEGLPVTPLRKIAA